MAKQSFPVCFCCIRTFIHRVLEPPEDVKEYFQDYSQNGTMSIDGLREFLSEVQGQKNTSEDDAQAIFNSLKHLNIFPRKGLHLEAFYRYLLGDLNTPLSPSSTIHQDMTAPLADYFIYTGHNSYLTGNQLSSESSVEPIKKALLNGVRVIELDLWPARNIKAVLFQGRNNDVVVCHGRTLTSSVKLLKCLRAIKEYAFQVSEYPVVITFEDHLPADLRVKVAKMVTETFGDMLYRPKTDQLEKLSPESLKRKVLISTKPPKEHLETQNNNSPPKSKRSSKKEQAGDDEKTASKNYFEIYDKDHSSRINLFNCSFMCSGNKQDEIDEAGEQFQEQDEEMRISEYRDLIAIHAGKPKGGLENWFRIDEKEVRRLSLSEQELENASVTHGKDIIRFTQHNFLRVYPKGTRVDSSNYDPFVGWMHGAQMVAFNMQFYRKHLWIMQGFFRANGGCGYVKKPDFLLQKDVFDPRVLQVRVKKILKVKIYSGEGWHLDFPHTHFDLYSPPDFLVKVGIAGVRAHKASKTNIVQNSWLPEWNEEFKFELIVPELEVLRIEVLEDDGYGQYDFGGQTYLPISELRTGIRAVPLHDRGGVKYKNARLLMKFDLLDPPKISLTKYVETLFHEYSPDGTMSVDGLREFLSKVQGQSNNSEDDAQAIFNSLKHQKGLDLEAFYQYLLGDLNSPFSPSGSVRQDMTAPLAHYFMYTAHNSYLTGNQLSSESSVEPIKKALLNGVRVIELDLWPSRNKVVVCNGRTLTSSVELLKCFHAIKKFAFQASEYPVVINFEDHLPAHLQAKVTEMITITFGDMLYLPKTDQLQQLPSPESLKKKVLISTKPSKKYLESRNSRSPGKSKTSKNKQEEDDKDEIDMGDQQFQEEYEEMKIPEYGHLIAFHAMKPKGELENWFRVDEKEVKCLSLSEQELENGTSTHGNEIARFTQHNLLRVYPKGTRLYSSNYDPFVGWMHGAQMVAFNMQGYGKHLWVMQGMFRVNGGCGYVKKPEFLLIKEVFDPRVQLPVKKILEVKIYSGKGWHLDFPPTHFDQYSPPDFFIKVGIVGVQADKAKDKTNIVKDNWQPEWNKEFKFKLTVPELALLRVEVLEHDMSGKHDFGGQTCLPISELRTGIRAVPLHNRRGERYKNTRLLMKFGLLDPNECYE